MSEIGKTFEQTLEWVPLEEKLRKERVEGISGFYLFTTSIVIIGFMCFIVYLLNTESTEFKSLKMMQDPENFYEDDFSEGYDNVSEIEYVSEESSLPLPPIEESSFPLIETTKLDIVEE